MLYRYPWGRRIINKPSGFLTAYFSFLLGAGPEGMLSFHIEISAMGPGESDSGADLGYLLSGKAFWYAFVWCPFGFNLQDIYENEAIVCVRLYRDG